MNPEVYVVPKPKEEGGVWGSYVKYVKALEEVAAAAGDLFPSEAGIWDSPRMSRVRLGLIELGADPAPTVRLYHPDNPEPSYAD